MRLEHRTNRAAKVGSHCEVAPLIEIAFVQTIPAAVDFASANRAAHHPHHVAMTVIGSLIPVFFYGSAEFGDHEHDGVAVSRPQRRFQARKTIAERTKMVGELAVA